MSEPSYIVRDAVTGRRLAVARDAVRAEEKACEQEGRGRLVAVTRGPRFRPVRGSWRSSDVPAGYRLLEPRRLAPATLRRDRERWVAEAVAFPVEWGRWGQGHMTANVAHACHDRGLIQIAVPVGGRGVYLYRRVR